jgi:hypothetical protein
MALTIETRTILTWGSATSALFLAFTYFNLIPPKFTGLGTAVIFFMFGSVMLTESIIEESRRRNVSKEEVIREMSGETATSLFLAISGYLFGILTFLRIEMTAELRAIAGFLLLIMALNIIRERYR